MPVARELRVLYSRSAGWPEVREAILARAGGRCECEGLCGGHRGRCGAPDRARIIRRPLQRGIWRHAGIEPGSIRVILSVAHLNQVAGDDRPENLAALCQRCHLVHDLHQHLASRARRERRERIALGQLELPHLRAA